MAAPIIPDKAGLHILSRLLARTLKFEWKDLRDEGNARGFEEGGFEGLFHNLSKSN